MCRSHHHVKNRVLGTKWVLDHGGMQSGSWSSGCSGSGGEEMFAHLEKSFAGGMEVVGVLHPWVTAGTPWVPPAAWPLGDRVVAGSNEPYSCLGTAGCHPGGRRERSLKKWVAEGKSITCVCPCMAEPWTLLPRGFWQRLAKEDVPGGGCSG